MAVFDNETVMRLLVHRFLGIACFYSVLTTIQQPTPAVHRLSKTVSQLDGHLIIVGDRKGPTEYPLKGTELLTLDNQLELPLTLPRLLPVNHYTRKNTGYLLAISHGATCLYETDDDNFPAAGWKLRARETKARVVSKGPCSPEPLHSPTALGAVAGNVFDPQLRQGSPDLGRVGLVHRPSGFGRCEKVASPVGVKATEEPFLFDDVPQAFHHENNE